MQQHISQLDFFFVYIGYINYEFLIRANLKLFFKYIFSFLNKNKFEFSFFLCFSQNGEEKESMPWEENVTLATKFYYNLQLSD